MKFLLDFLPLLLFFGTFKFAENHKEWAAAFASDHFGFMVSGGIVGTEEAPVLLATLVVIMATIVQVITLKLMRRKVDLMLWITLALVVVLGGATVWFHNATFIKWKPTVVFAIMAVALYVAQAFFKKNMLESMMGGGVTLPPAVWVTLNRAWVGFFLLMSVLNMIVAYQFSTSTWATFKAFGVPGLLFAFTIVQVIYLSRYVKDDDKPQADKPAPAAE